MDPNQPKINPGKFMSALGPGAGAAVMRAIQRRNLGNGGTNQSTQGGTLPASPPVAQGNSFPTPPTQMPPTQAASPVPVPATPPPGQSTPITPGPQPTPSVGGDPNTQIILKSMADYLDSVTKINEAQAGLGGTPNV